MKSKKNKSLLSQDIGRKVREKTIFFLHKLGTFSVNVAAGKGEMTDQQGRPWKFGGLKFTGQIRDGFWNFYLFPMLAEFTTEITTYVVSESEKNKLRLDVEMDVLKKEMERLYQEVYKKAAEVDAVARGNGMEHPPQKNITPKVNGMISFLDFEIKKETEKYNNRYSFKNKIKAEFSNAPITLTIAAISLIFSIIAILYKQ